MSILKKKNEAGVYQEMAKIQQEHEKQVARFDYNDYLKTAPAAPPPLILPETVYVVETEDRHDMYNRGHILKVFTDFVLAAKEAASMHVKVGVYKLDRAKCVSVTYPPPIVTEVDCGDK